MADATEIRARLMARYLGVTPGTGEDQVLRLIVETGVRAAGADEGSLLVHDATTNDLTFLMTYGGEGSEDTLVGQRVPLGKGITGLAAETREVQIGAPVYKDVTQTATMGRIQSVIAAPMVLGERLIGVLTAVSNREDKRFSMADAQLYACLSTVAALVVHQLERLRAFQDGVGESGTIPLALSPDPAEQEVMDRVSRLLQRDPGTIRQLARMLEAVEAMSTAGAPR